MTRREEDKKNSLAALGRIADKAKETPWIEKRSALPTTHPKPKPRPAPAPAQPRAPAPNVAAERARLKRLEERREKLAEEKRLRERRDGELHRAKVGEWRGMPHAGVAKGIARTPFDKTEPSLFQKIDDVLGAAKQKEGRVKHREKGRRQG